MSQGHLNPITERLEEESRTKNNGKIHPTGYVFEPSGYELAAKMGNAEPGFGPTFGFENIVEELNTKPGLEFLKGEQLVYGTSFCRADSKEITQTAAIVQALRQGSNTDITAAYFIDPNSHSLKEYIDAIGLDYKIDRDILDAIFETDIVNGREDPYESLGGAKPFSLPPAYYKLPSQEKVEALDLPPEVKDIWISTLAEMQNPGYSKPATFGNWIVEINKEETKRLLIKLGYTPDLINVYSLDDILTHGDQVDIVNIASDVESASKTEYPKVTEIAKSREGESQEHAKQNGNGEMGMFCLIGQDGQKILITQNYEPVIFEGKQRINLTTEPIPEHFQVEPYITYRRICESISGMTFEEAQRNFPIQPSGVGYYTILGRKIRDKAVVLADDYERARGPYSIMAFVKNKYGFGAISTPKGLVGSNGNYNIPPDLGMLLTMDPKSTNKLRQMMDEVQRQFMEDDIAWFTGASISYDIERKKAAVRVDKVERYVAIALQKLAEKIITTNPLFHRQRHGSTQKENVERETYYALYNFNPYSISEAIKADPLYDQLYKVFPTKARIAIYLARLNQELENGFNPGKTLATHLGIEYEFQQAASATNEIRLMHIEKTQLSSRSRCLVGEVQLTQNEEAATKEYLEIADDSSTTKQDLLTQLVRRNTEGVTSNLCNSLRENMRYKQVEIIQQALSEVVSQLKTDPIPEGEIEEKLKAIMPGLVDSKLYKYPEGQGAIAYALLRHEIYVYQEQAIALGILSPNSGENILENYSIDSPEEISRLRKLKTALDREITKRIQELAKAQTKEEVERQIRPRVHEINQKTIPSHILAEYERITVEIDLIKGRLGELGEELGQFSDLYQEAWTCRTQEVLQKGVSI